MEYVRVGSSGLEVSAITLGTMSFGDPHRGNHEWTLTEDESRPFLQKALELGITTFDTANVYSDGTSEEIVGRALHEFARREDIVIWLRRSISARAFRSWRYSFPSWCWAWGCSAP